MTITLPRALELDIMNFVNLNEIEDINSFFVSCIRDGFNIVKYGTSPMDNFKKENKPFKIENNEYKEEVDIEGLEGKKNKRKNKSRKQQPSSTEEVSEQAKEAEELIVPKKKIRIIKK